MAEKSELHEQSAKEPGALQAHDAKEHSAHEHDDQLNLEEMPEEEMLYDLADLFKVFADTTRIKILFALMNGPQCVNDIAQIINASQTAVSHQLRILKQAHLIKFQRNGKNVFYSLSDDHVHTMLSQGLTHICE